ncbi:hypothetical protein Gohar_013737, partial [Gossypium harknessii]|nr:hypothetical protein [Gossypium harknessii]
MYIGTGCFHRREALCGKQYEKNYKVDWKKLNDTKANESASVLEETCKVLASCTFEHNTPWGKEMGLKYGILVEDIITGLSIKCRGWKSIYLNPEREGFLGVAPTTLLQLLVQHTRWAEGHLQIFLSRYCSLVYGYKRIPLKLRLAYCPFNLWAANCLATLYYVVVPCLCLLKGFSLFPKISSPWVVPFVYVAFVHRAYSLGEFLWCGGTFRGWCNDQRVWLFKRTTSYFFAFFQTILKLLGYSQLTFALTAKVSDENVSERFEQELIEFGATSPMFDILATLAMLNLFGSFGAIKKVILDADEDFKVLDQFGLQILLCLVLVTINLPVYQALFFRKDNGKMPSSVTYKSIIFALLACTSFGAAKLTSKRHPCNGKNLVGAHFRPKLLSHLSSGAWYNVLVLGIGGHSSGKFWVKSWDFIMNKGKLESKSYLPLFETRPARGRQLFQLFSASMSITICFIWVYRVSYFPAAEAKAERWTWLGLFLAELWFSFYWSLTLIFKWNPVFRTIRKLFLEYKFVSTRDPGIEPPIMMINTVLSVMAYEYPSEKLSVHPSDDGCSDLTFYALLEAASFSRIWLPFCRKLKVEPRLPEAYFRKTVKHADDSAMAK